LWGLSEDELSGYGAVVTQELQSGDPKLISNYLAKIPPGNNQTFSDPTKVFKLWDWAQCVNIGIAIDYQLYAHHWPYSYKALLTPKDFFAQKEELFKIHLGQDHFFSSGAIVVYRH
jgi:hypothetical protein